MTHTPGPWRVGIRASAEHGKVFGRETDEHYRERMIAFCPTDEGPIGSGEANAELIAASPTMYEYIENRAKLGSLTARKLLEEINAN